MGWESQSGKVSPYSIDGNNGQIVRENLLVNRKKYYGKELLLSKCLNRNISINLFSVELYWLKSIPST